MRLKIGDVVEIFNGKDDLYLICNIGSISKQSIDLVIEKLVSGSQNIKQNNFILALCAVKKEQMEDAVRLCTEVGINEIVFIKSQHSQNQYINFERLVDISISAAMQCRINILPTIKKGTETIDDFLNKASGTLIFANETLNHQPKIQNKITKQQNTYILIGPEGGFAPNEISLILKQRQNLILKQVYLGKNILRSSTAATVACFSTINGFFCN